MIICFAFRFRFNLFVEAFNLIGGCVMATADEDVVIVSAGTRVLMITFFEDKHAAPFAETIRLEWQEDLPLFYIQPRLV